MFWAKSACDTMLSNGCSNIFSLALCILFAITWRLQGLKFGASLISLYTDSTTLFSSRLQQTYPDGLWKHVWRGRVSFGGYEYFTFGLSEYFVILVPFLIWNWLYFWRSWEPTFDENSDAFSSSFSFSPLVPLFLFASAPALIFLPRYTGILMSLFCLALSAKSRIVIDWEIVVGDCKCFNFLFPIWITPFESSSLESHHLNRHDSLHRRLRCCSAPLPLLPLHLVLPPFLRRFLHVHVHFLPPLHSIFHACLASIQELASPSARTAAVPSPWIPCVPVVSLIFLPSHRLKQITSTSSHIPLTFTCNFLFLAFFWRQILAHLAHFRHFFLVLLLLLRLVSTFLKCSKLFPVSASFHSLTPLSFSFGTFSPLWCCSNPLFPGDRPGGASGGGPEGSIDGINVGGYVEGVYVTGGVW